MKSSNGQLLNIVRGRGYLFKEKKLNSENSNISPSKFGLTEDVKRDFIHNGRVPMRSTYIPKELNENDGSIYETGINSGINFEKLNEVEVKITGKNIPEKIESFEAYNSISENLMENIKKCKYIKPTPIQKHTIPIILSGKDLIAAAQTGSGKTVCFHSIN